MSGVERLPIQDYDVEHRARDRADSSPDHAGSPVNRFLRWIDQRSNKSLALDAIPPSTSQHETRQDPVSPSSSSRIDLALQSRQSCDHTKISGVGGNGTVPISAASPRPATPKAPQIKFNPDFDVWVNLSSRSIYHLKHGIYIAFPMKIPVPAVAMSIYETEVKENLLSQLEVAFKNVEQIACRSGSTIDWVSERVSLQMLGKDIFGNYDIDIKLSPRICVRCPKGQKRYMEKFMQDYSLNWISRSIFGPIVVLPAAELSGSNYPPFIWELGKESIPMSMRIETAGEGGLFIQGVQKSLVVQLHIGIPEGARSLHGAICRASIIHQSRILAQSYSRIGGLVNSGSEIFGITTAHHLLDGFWHEMTGHDHADEPEGPSARNVETKTPTREESPPAMSGNHEDEDSSDDDYDPSYRCRRRNVHTTNPAEITLWTRVHLYLGTSFSTTAMVSLNEKWTVMFRMYQQAVFSDFALVRLPADWVATNFLNLTSQTTISPSMSLPILDEDYPPASPMAVCVMLGVDGNIEGCLYPGRQNLVVRGQQLATRVIELKEGSLPRGSSGAWVMSAHGIRGMIVASSQSEPFAYMIDADQLQKDLNRLSHSASRRDRNLTLIQPVGQHVPRMTRRIRRFASYTNPFSPVERDHEYIGPLGYRRHADEDSDGFDLEISEEPDTGPSERVHEDLRPSWTSF